jgi:nucleotide-binding universal stress UspA family protein
MLARVHEPFFLSTIDLAPETVAPIDRWQQEILDSENAYLARITKRIALATALEADAVLLHGDAVQALNQFVLESDSILVVMTTHGRGGFERAWLGSVADEFVRRASVPVLLVRPVEQVSPEIEVPAPARFLVPLDGSAASESILESVLTVGGGEASSYALIRVIEDPWALSPHDMAAARVTAKAAADAYLERVARWLRKRASNVTTKVLFAGNVARAILDEAAAVNADAIAMATHSRHGLARITRGSVADKVTRLATLPVLVLRPKEG